MRLFIMCTAALLTASVATAQVPGQPVQPRLPQINNNVRLGGSAGDYQRRLAANAINQDQQEQAGPSEQVALIERIAPLVAEGRCNEARQIARQEGDRAVSRRIGEVCVEGRPTPMPPSSS